MIRTHHIKEETVSLPKRYDAGTAEPELQNYWQTWETYHFSTKANGWLYWINTPPLTVWGHATLGHAYSYSHTDFLPFFCELIGYMSFFPLAYNVKGLPTIRY